MSLDLHEQLSRLEAGDLPADEAEALRARIRNEPEVAATHEQLTRLLRALPDLEDGPPPPHLHDRILARTHGAEPEPVAAPRPVRSWAWPAALVAAACALLVVRWVTLPAPAITLVEGRQHLDGQALVLAPGARIEVDGEAVISVEPGTGSPRRSRQEDIMDKNHLLAAAAGSAITVVVLQGSAVIWPDAADTEPVHVAEGQTHTVGEARRTAEVRRPAAAAPDRLDPETAAYISELEDKVAALSFENSLVHGQLETHRGTPVEWPAEVSALVSPEGFTATIEDVLANHPGLTLEAIDCAEYPCIAKITASGTEDDLRGHVQDLNASLQAQIPDDEVGLMLSAGISKNDDHPDAEGDLVLQVATMEEGDSGQDGNPVHERLQHRMREMEDSP